MIDLRSDVLAPPTDDMWAAMRSAELGWATFGEDRSVRTLEALAAELLGKEAGLFVPTCGAANLVALLTLAERGTQVVLESTAHIVTSEADGLAAVAGLRARTLPGRAGCLDPDDVALAIEGDRKRVRTTLVCLENTHTNAGGTVLTPDATVAVATVAHRFGAAVHLDGARLFNAAVALGVPARRLKVAAIAVSAAFTSACGALWTQYVGFVDPVYVFSLDLSVRFTLAAILGGLGTALGPFLGAVLVTTVETYLRAQFGGVGAKFVGIYLILYGSALILMVRFAPQGLVGWIGERVRRRAGARTTA